MCLLQDQPYRLLLLADAVQIPVVAEQKLAVADDDAGIRTTVVVFKCVVR